MRKENDTSYVVEANGRQYRRDRFHIRKSRELLRPESSVPNSQEDEIVVIPHSPRRPSCSQPPSSLVLHKAGCSSESLTTKSPKPGDQDRSKRG